MTQLPGLEQHFLLTTMEVLPVRNLKNWQYLNVENSCLVRLCDYLTLNGKNVELNQSITNDSGKDKRKTSSDLTANP